jgi:hypothetical protein
MVTETQPVPCLTCVDYDFDTEYPSESFRAQDVVVNLSGTSLQGASNPQNARPNPSPTTRPDYRDTSLTSTPSTGSPESPMQAGPHSTHYPSTAQFQRRDSSFRKTYDEEDKKRAIPCENCALTIPKTVKAKIPEGAPGNPATGYNGSPILRTRRPYETVPDSWLSPPKSTPSDSSDSDRSQRRRSRTLNRTAVTSSGSDTSSSPPPHTHYLNYTSTHDPSTPTSFSLLRQACLRTLSHESLPPSSTSLASPSSFASPTASSRSTSSGGPIFFGDPLAGYTTAFIFRIPDPHARGRIRQYAFIALSKAPERAVMKSFSFLSAAFRDLAGWITSLAEKEAMRLESVESTPVYTTVQTRATSSSTNTSPSVFNPPNSRFSNTPTASPTKKDLKEEKLTITPTSSFLSGRPCDPDGVPRKGSAGSLRARGLAELVGRADFFIELHARFVALLAQLALVFGQ